MYCCNICSLFASPSFSAVLRHIGNTHAGDPNLSIVCPVPGCPRESPYSNYESFRSHVYRKHREVLDSGLSRSNVEGGRKDPEDISEGSGDEDSIERGNSDCNTEGFEPQSSGINLQSSAARFLLKTREERKITQSALDGIVHDVTDLWDVAMKQVHV